MIKRLIKIIPLEYGTLYSVINGDRIALAKCSPKIEVYEYSSAIKAIGMLDYAVKRMHVTLIICPDIELTREINDEFFKNVERFELSADIQRFDGVFENIAFNNLLPREIDLDGEWIFETELHPGFAEKFIKP